MTKHMIEDVAERLRALDVVRNQPPPEELQRLWRALIDPPKNPTTQKQRNTPMTDINTAAAAIGGEWVKLTRKEHGSVEGRVVSFETRPMTFEGAPVLNRKSGQPRTEWVLAIQKDDGETVKLSLKESGQRAVSDAIKAAHVDAKNGDRLKIAVSRDPASDREQPTYQARWTADSSALGVPTDDVEAPF